MKKKKKIHRLYQNRNSDFGEKILISVKMAISEQEKQLRTISVFMDTSKYPAKRE